MKSSGRFVALMFVSSLLVSLTTSIYLVAPASAQSIPYNQGDLFAATANGSVIDYTPLGKIVQTLSTGSSFEETGMCFDSQEDLYVTNFSGHSMSKFDPQGNLLSSNYAGPFSGSPESCAFMANGNMLVGQVDSGELYEFSPTGSLVKTFFPQTQNRGIDWISLSSDGCTLYYTSEGSSVLRYNICTATQEADFATGLPSPCYANQLAGNGDFFVACSSEVVDLTASGSLRRSYSVPDTSSLFAFALDPNGTSFWTADYNTGEIVEIDIANGSVLSSFSAGQSIQGLAQLGSNGPVGGSITSHETLGGHNPSEKGANQCNQGSPVNCATGDFWHTFTDASIPGPGPYLDLSRTYNSLVASTKGPFGYGWSSSYTMHLVFDSTTGDVTVCQENGSIVTFTPNSTGTYSAPPRVDGTLVKNSDGTYSFTRDKWETFTFNSSGLLTAEQDVSGYKTTLSYNSSGQLISVTDFAGRSLEFTYGANGLVSSVADPMGRITTYQYDSDGELISVTDPMGRVTSFTYNANHLLYTMTDPNGGVVTNVYDQQGRVISQTDPMGRVIDFSYSSTGTTITEPNGNITVENYLDGELTSITQAAGTPEAATWSYTYDQETAEVASVTDPNGNTTTYTYDQAGNILSSTNALLDTTTYSYNSFGEQTCIAAPEASSSCSKLTPPAPYPASVTNINPPSSIPPPFVTYSQYDTNGNLIWTTTGVYQPNSTTASYAQTSYYLYNNQSVVLGGTTDSCTNKAPSASLACATINPNGAITQISYDLDGNVVKVYSPNTNLSSTGSSGQLSTTTFTYNTDSELMSTVSPNGNVSGANAANYTTIFSYNKDGEVTTKTQGGPGASIIPRITSYSYDANGNNTSVSNSMSPHLVGSDSAISSSSGISLTLPPGSAPGDEALLSVVSPTPRPSTLASFVPGDIYTYVGNGSYGSSGVAGPATSASLNGPYYVAATANGNLALADRNNSVVDFVPATSGTYFGQQMTAGDIYRVAGNETFGSSGIGGPATSASLNGPSSVAFDSFGNLYITDSDNSRIDFVPATSGTYFGQQMTAGYIYTIAGNGGFGYSGNGGPATSAELDGPQGIAVAPSGALFIADTNNNVVRMVPSVSGTYFGQQMIAGDIYSIVGNGSYGSSGIGGPATSASLNGPSAVTTDASGNLFLSDHNNNVVDMLPATSGTYFGQQMTVGDIYRVAGNGNGGDSINGGSATSASLNGPGGLAVDTNENLVIADAYDARVQVVAGHTGTYFGQQMTTGDIYNIVGTGNPGYSGNGGSANIAQVDGPSSVALDGFGDLFIADTNNDVVRLVGGSSTGPAFNVPKGFSLFSSKSVNGEETSVYLGAVANLTTTNNGTINITGSNTTNGSATLGVFGDVNTTDPIDAFSSASSLSQASTLSLPALTTKYQGDLLVLSAGALIPTSSSGTTQVSPWKLPSGLADISSTQPSSLPNSSFTDILAQDPSNLPVDNTSPFDLSLSNSSGLSGIELALRPGNQFSTTTTTYNADNEPVMSTNPDGSSSLTCYDANGQVTEIVPPIGVAKNSLSPSSCAASNIYPSGYLFSSGTEREPVSLASDANLFTYNATGEKTTMITPPPAGQTTPSLSTYTYDLSGNLIETQSPSPSNVSGSALSITTYNYNGANELISTTTAQGTPTSSTTSNCYDPNGDITARVPGDGNSSGLSSCKSSFPWGPLCQR